MNVPCLVFGSPKLTRFSLITVQVITMEARYLLKRRQDFTLRYRI